MNYVSRAPGLVLQFARMLSLLAMLALSSPRQMLEAAPERSASPCTLTPDLPTSCKGLLPAGFLNNPQIRDLRRAKHDTVLDFGRGETHREATSGSTVVRDGQYAWTEINKDARDIDLKDLSEDYPIVMGSIRLRHSGLQERRYRVGRNLVDDQEFRRLFFVAHREPWRLAANGVDTIVARWTLFRIGRNAKRETVVIKENSSGFVVKCGLEHPESKDLEAHFLACPEEPDKRHRASLLGMKLTEYLNLFTCNAGRVIPGDKTRDKRCAQAIARKQERVMRMLTPERKSALDSPVSPFADPPSPNDAPYWFACAGGCCTADQ